MKAIAKTIFLAVFLLWGYASAAQSSGYFRKPMKFEIIKDKNNKDHYTSFSVEKWLQRQLAFPEGYVPASPRVFKIYYTVSSLGIMNSTIVPQDESDPLYGQLKKMLAQDVWVPAMRRSAFVPSSFVDSLSIRFAYPEIEFTPDQSDVKNNSIFEGFIEQMPVFPGGTEALMRFFTENGRYKPEWHQAGMNGTVIVRFFISKEGYIDNLRVLRTPHIEFAHEVMRVLSMSPRWEPARQNGEPIVMPYNIPVKFVHPDSVPARKNADRASIKIFRSYEND